MRKGTRSLLITAAAELLDGGGPAAVTLREVGRRAGVSHNAPYKHFADKEELLAAVATRELARQSKLMRAANGSRRTATGIQTLMRGYVRWARTHPARFKLAFGSWTMPNDELGAAASEARGLLVKLVEVGQARGELPSGNPDRLAALLHSVAHGAVDLALAGHLSSTGKGSADPEDLIDDLLGHLRPPRPVPTARRRRPTR